MMTVLAILGIVLFAAAWIVFGGWIHYRRIVRGNAEYLRTHAIVRPDESTIEDPV